MPPRVSPRVKRQYRRTFIREWREHRGLSQDQLVERVLTKLETFSKATLSRVENAQQAYTQPMLEAISWALNVEPEDLIVRRPDSEFWTLVDTLKGVGPEDRAQIARIVATFRKTS